MENEHINYAGEAFKRVDEREYKKFLHTYPGDWDQDFCMDWMDTYDSAQKIARKHMTPGGIEYYILKERENG